MPHHVIECTESVKDGNGCRRSLSAARDLEVEVRRTRPTARFGGMGGTRSVAIRDNDSAKIPLRLMGEAVSPDGFAALNWACD